MSMAFNETIRVRLPAKLKARLLRIAVSRGKKTAEVHREALLSYADNASKAAKRDKAAA